MVSFVEAASTSTTNLATGVTGTLSVSNGGTEQTSYTNGQLLIGNTTGNTLAKATLTGGDGITVSNGTGSISLSTDLKSNGGIVIESEELAIDLGASSVTGTLSVGDGGTGQTSYTNGQLLIGNTTGNTLAKATLTGGGGIDVTNGTGSISLSVDVVHATGILALSVPGQTGVKGEIRFDDTYLYVCVDTDTWKRVAYDGSWV